MDKYKLYGFCSPSSTSYSFLTPLFKLDDKYYTQIIGDKDVILDFEEVVPSEIKFFEGGTPPELSNGESALFGISDHKHDAYGGTQSELKHYLRSTIEDYIDKPFFYKDVSEFCEKALPEFYGCQSSKDFLVRQVISNLIPSFIDKLNVRLEKKESKLKKYSESFYLSEIFSNKYESKLRLASEEASLKDTYKAFVHYATEKHKNLLKHKSITESLEMADVVFTHFTEHEQFDYTHIKNNLTYILDNKVISGDEKYIYKSNLNKQLRKLYANHSDTSNALQSKSVTTEGLSLIIYVTSRFTQEAIKRSIHVDCDDNIKYITNR